MKGQEATHPSSNSAAQAPAAPAALPAGEDLSSRPGLICNNAWTNPALPAAMAHLGTEQPIEPASMLPVPVPVQVPEGMDAVTVVMPMTCSVPLSSSSTSSAAASPHSATSPMPSLAEDQQLEQLLAQMLMGMDAVRPAAAWPTIHEGSETPIYYQPAIPAEVEDAALAAAAAVRGPACDDLVHPLSPVDATKKEEQEDWAPHSPARPVCFTPAFAVEQKGDEEGEEPAGEPPPPLASDPIACLPAAAEAPPTAAPAALVSDETPAQEEDPALLHSLVALDMPQTDYVLGDASAASPHSASTESVYATSPAASPLQERSIARSPTTAAYHCLVDHQGADTPMCYQPTIPAEVEEAALAGGAAFPVPVLPPHDESVPSPISPVDTTGKEEEEDWEPNSPACPVCFAPAFAAEQEQEEEEEEEEAAGEPPPSAANEPSAIHHPVAAAAPDAINATDGAGHSTFEQTLEDCEEAYTPQEEPALHSLVALGNSMLQTDALLDDASAAAVASPHSASTESVYATSPAPAADAESTTGGEATEQQLMEQEELVRRPTVRFQLPTEADMHSDVGSEGDAEQATSAVASAVQEAGLVALRGLLLVMLALLTAASWVWTWVRALW